MIVEPRQAAADL